MTDLLYAKAIANFRDNPGTAMRRLAYGSATFVSELPSVLVQGYALNGTSFSIYFYVWLVLIAFTWIRAFMNRANSVEISFWLLIWLSAIGSAAFVYLDDGRRTMMVIYPLAALFFTIPMPVSDSDNSTSAARPMIPPLAGACVIGVALLVIAITPALMHLFAPFYYPAPKESDENLVFGGRRMTGMLVVADEAPLRNDVPSIHISDFVNIVRHTQLEESQDLVTPAPPKVPFGFIATPLRSYELEQLRLYIVPPKVLSRPEVAGWRFRTSDLGRTHDGNRYWRLVSQADTLGP